MFVGTKSHTENTINEKRLPPVARRYQGKYMPFAGVTYYGNFTESEVAEGGNRIGPVGWRPETKRRDTSPAIAA